MIEDKPKPIIKSSTMEVSSHMLASNFTQKVYDLLNAYVHNKIIVRIETKSGLDVLDDLEIRDGFDFDLLRGAFYRNTSQTVFICTVMVVR